MIRSKFHLTPWMKIMQSNDSCRYLAAILAIAGRKPEKILALIGLKPVSLRCYLGAIIN